MTCAIGTDELCQSTLTQLLEVPLGRRAGTGELPEYIGDLQLDRLLQLIQHPELAWIQVLAGEATGGRGLSSCDRGIVRLFFHSMIAKHNPDPICEAVPTAPAGDQVLPTTIDPVLAQ